MKKTRDDHEKVKFHFVMKIGNDRHEVNGTKTLKLFRSWFRLACNFHYKYTPKSQQRDMCYGIVEFEDGETWIWQNKKHVLPGGWHLAKDPTPVQTKLF